LSLLIVINFFISFNFPKFNTACA